LRLPTDQPIAAPPGVFRRWLCSDMRVLRWVFLALYGLLVLAFLLLPVIGGDGGAMGGMLIAVGVMFVAQALLIFGAGTIRLCHPIRRRRLILPVFVGATMLGLLVAGFLIAMTELFKLDSVVSEELILGVIFVSWIGWGVLLWLGLRDRARHTILARITTWVFAGSLAELVATVPAHVIVTRRPGCLVGLSTMLGIVAGVAVMTFSFGPMIALLFLRPRLRAETTTDGVPYCPACGYDLRASRERCPECGLPFQDSLVTR
jgi:hypothetical protein